MQIKIKFMAQYLLFTLVLRFVVIVSSIFSKISGMWQALVLNAL